MKVYEWSWGKRDACPASDHPKKLHKSNRVSKRTVTQTHPGFRKKPFTSTSYVDHVVCAFCGVEHDQEWMSAGI